MLPHVAVSPRKTALFAVLLVLVAVIAPFGGAVAQPAPRDRGGPPIDIQGEHAGHRDADHRRGRIAPSRQQQASARSLAARVTWTDFGTPASLAPAASGVLSDGLPADEVAAARAWIDDHRALFRLSEAGVDALELLNAPAVGDGKAVLFRQRFGHLPAGYDGLLTVAVVDGAVVYVTSSLAGDGNTPAAATLSAETAVAAAAEDAGRPIGPGQVEPAGSEGRYRAFDVDGFTHAALVRLVAVPTVADGVRPAFEVVLVDNEATPLAVTSYVDARSGDVLVVEENLDYLDEDESRWTVFPVSPPLDYSAKDTRELWCWLSADAACDYQVGNDASPSPWDVDAETGASTTTTDGNNAIAVHNWFSNNPFTVGTETATARPNRDYTYDWSNQWNEQRCNPEVFDSPQRNDIDAARANLFAMHNRMHDWSYNLGFTEQTYNLQDFNYGRGGAEDDPEQGNAQAGGVSGGPPTFRARDNANQITRADGIAPITNMYLWQPIAGGFYAPCVDGDFDMTVIGHEYTHAITNRMVAGPDIGLSGLQARAMGESWSDYVGMEYLNAYGFVPIAGENPWAVGPYVTNDEQAGIRNYGMNHSPLNYSDVGYDLTGPQVHADGEIWSATNYRLREAFVRRYDSAFPAGDRALQRRCADGEVPAERCPGNRRWMQLTFDSLLLLPSRVSMLDARDALLAADMLRFGGANADLLWDVFASRGLGAGASSVDTDDTDPVPSFSSPFADEATVRFEPRDDAGRIMPEAKLFVGRYEARAVAVADTDPATPLGDEVDLVAGTYDFVVQAPAYGARRFRVTLQAGTLRPLEAAMPRNHASAASGATASGDGINLDKLIDDTEATNWASLDAPVAGRQVTVRLGGGQPQFVRRVQVSAMLRPREAEDPGGDTGSQSRFSALRQFELRTCLARGGVDCSSDTHFATLYVSPADAFPSVAPRPRAPELIMREFSVAPTRATHVQLRVVTNQCTGASDYAGDQDDDPRNATDCSSASAQANNVRAAELQVFTR